MKISKLDIRDFGVFQGEKLEDLGQGIVVIGGANRAGKSSFMHMLRCLGYGFNKKDIPPCTFQYDVRSELLMDNEEVIDMQVKGYGAPQGKNHKTGEMIDCKNIYNNLDSYTYKELFTISLDELNRLTDKEDNKLNSVLLGAGLSSIIKIPELSSNFRKEAEKIGGKNGIPTTKMFKPYSSTIKEGIKLRDKSLNQINMYIESKNKLSMVESEITNYEDDIKKTEENILILDVLKNNYDLYVEKKQLKNELINYSMPCVPKSGYFIERAEMLQEEYVETLDQYNSKVLQYKNKIDENIEGSFLVYSFEKEINYFNNQLSGYREKVKNYINMKEEYKRKKENALLNLKATNDKFSYIDQIKLIHCDSIHQMVLANEVEQYKVLQEERKSTSKNLEKLNLEKISLQEKYKEFSKIDTNYFMNKYFLMSIIFLILGISVIFINKAIGVLICSVGISASIIYLLMKIINNRNNLSRKKEVMIEINSTKSLIYNDKSNLESIEQSICDLNKKFNEYRVILKLDQDITGDGLKEYYNAIKNLKNHVIEIDFIKEKINSEFAALGVIMNNIQNLTKNFINVFKLNNDIVSINNMKEYSENIFGKIEDLKQYLFVSQELILYKNNKEALEKEITTFLDLQPSEYCMLDKLNDYIKNGIDYKNHVNVTKKLNVIEDKINQSVNTERVKMSIINNTNISLDNTEVAMIIAIENFYKDYLSLEDIDRKYHDMVSLNNSLKKSLEDLKNTKQSLKDNIKRNCTDTDLKKSQELIHEGRRYLKPMAEKYALYNTAALILDNIKDRFIDKAKDSLLKDASEILENITSGEYKEIIPMEDLTQCDFKTIINDNNIKESSNILSRATKEQLFLAIRISRIKDIKPCLPVVLDDTFVNFDMAHTKNTIDTFIELSKTHQIFILTCHSYLVDYLKSKGQNTQFWKLEKGKFTLSGASELSGYLKNFNYNSEGKPLTSIREGYIA